ncbi:hypothetical protein NEOLEDRAFT_1152733 [Neolentinus lepideus HHB14362 ss-1]|uniref:Uncharacterized protein n=1 Tax=Neolentinus lepideus HHB14362 ss-1 TaxID=1314782 RepID=A0A165MDR6_9AGAM|nr:hypothetical protein NEOLEDRAFT_1152733 [Neolentinus lepideus HHB14362 ss-1]
MYAVFIRRGEEAAIMPVEYIYALHNFIPEHDNKMSFKASERIGVVKRDDLYGDRWGQQQPTAPAMHASRARVNRSCMRDNDGCPGGIEQLHWSNRDGGHSFSFASMCKGDAMDCESESKSKVEGWHCDACKVNDSRACTWWGPQLRWI